MNKKLLKASIAGTAALALAAGGSTFAAWSDFGVESTEAGAGYLRLSVDTLTKAGANVKPFQLEPGDPEDPQTNKFQEFYLSSADSGNTPAGNLTMKIKTLVDNEDQPTCTTSSEAVAEGGVCGGANQGELSRQAKVQILKAAPVGGTCPSTGYASVSPSVNRQFLFDLQNDEITLGTLAPGQGMCVRMEMALEHTTAMINGTNANNLTQGDDASFDVEFTLDQVVDW